MLMQAQCDYSNTFKIGVLSLLFVDKLVGTPLRSDQNLLMNYTQPVL